MKAEEGVTMSQMEQDADRVATETFDLFKQLITRKYSTPEMARLGADIGDVSDPRLALYAASKLIDVTAARLGITGGARVMAQEKLVGKVREYYESPQARQPAVKSQTAGRAVIIAIGLLLVLAIYWFGFRL